MQGCKGAGQSLSTKITVSLLKQEGLEITTSNEHQGTPEALGQLVPSKSGVTTKSCFSVLAVYLHYGEPFPSPARASPIGVLDLNHMEIFI